MIFISIVFILSTIFNLSMLRIKTKAVAPPTLLGYARATPRLQYTETDWLMDMVGFNYGGNDYRGYNTEIGEIVDGHLYAQVGDSSPSMASILSDATSVGGPPASSVNGIIDICVMLFNFPAFGGGLAITVLEDEIPAMQTTFREMGGTLMLDPFEVWKAKGETSDYEWVYSAVTASSAKAITSFNFSGLDPAVPGNVNETAKTVALTVPYGTAVTNLVATFVTTGSSVAVGVTSQVSGTTANNFTTPQTYTVTAEDATTQPYIVTVTIALPPPAYVAPPDSIVTPPSPEPSAPVVPEPVVEPVITDDDYFKTVIQSTPLPDFNPEWGIGYFKDGQSGRTAWALEHRFNIYQSYIDILGRKPTAIEVNWWLTQEDDIWVIRWFFLNSEEYRNK